MFNKKAVRSMAAGAIVLSLAAVPVFASNRSNNNRNGQGGMLGGVENVRCNGAAIRIMGTVSSIDKTNSVITVKNADGKDVQVHISPVTYICSDDNVKTRLELSDIKEKDWISVVSFDTDTTIAEAKHIFIDRN